jgi:glycosyltransferase involved in cell wall biosynthesis
MTPELRILHVLPVWAPAWQYGGPVRSVGRLCQALAARGVAVEVVTTTAGLPDWPAAATGVPLQRDGVTVTYYPVDRAAGPIRSRALLQALPLHLARNQLLHLSAVWQPLGPPVQRAAQRAGLPVIHSLRGALGPYSLSRGWWKKLPYYWLVERPCLRRAAALQVTSARERRECANPLLGLGSSPPLWLLPNPLEPEAFGSDPAQGLAWRVAHGIPAQEPLLLVCGRHHHKKGLDLLGPVLAALAPWPWRLALVGPDEDGSAAALQQQLIRAGLGERLLPLPLQSAEDLPQLFHGADLLLMPSRHENFGNVALEALACGCAVLLSDGVGVGVELPQVLAGQPWGAVLPRRAEAWRQWLAAWLGEALTQPQGQHRRVDPAALGGHYGASAVAAACEAFYRSLLR